MGLAEEAGPFQSAQKLGPGDLKGRRAEAWPFSSSGICALTCGQGLQGRREWGSLSCCPVVGTPA